MLGSESHVGDAMSFPRKHQHRVVDYPAEHRAWTSMRHRCLNPDCKSYPAYGGRGIEITGSWLGDSGFDTFMRDMKPRPSARHSLERTDVNKGYFKGNCIWALPDSQANNKRTTRRLTYQGATHTLTQWARKTGLHAATLGIRLAVLGWTLERALTTPSRGRDQARAKDPAREALRKAIDRCHNPHSQAYENYGGRGILVCSKWHGEAGLMAFKKHMGDHPGAGFSLDRVDVNKGYVPGNCRWATASQQAGNRRGSRTLTYKGRTQSIPAWAREVGIAHTTLRLRLAKDWPLERVFARSAVQEIRATVA